MHFTTPLLGALTLASASPVFRRYTSGDTANDLSDGTCNPVTFIFARGSTEPGNLGLTVGPSVAKKLKSKLGQVTIQGVDYTASIASNVELGAGGGPVMAKLAKEAKQKCPNTKVFVGGYSQGCEVVHYAAKHEGMSSDYVDGAVLYGDPEDGTSVTGIDKDNIKEFCAPGDGVCETHTFDITAGHLSYTSNGDTTEGAEWIASKAGSASSSSSGSDSSAGSGTASASASAASSSGSSSGLSGLLSGGGSSGLSSLFGGSSSDSDSSDSSSSGSGLSSFLR